MNNTAMAYGKLCNLFYDATKTYAPTKEVNFYASFMDKEKYILEAMSGSGRLQIPLLQLGYKVDGVDNSKIMLNSCRQRSANLNLKPNLYEQSLENLNLPHKYQTITIAVGSFQLISNYNDALKALQNLYKHIEDNGNLLIDIFVPEITNTEPNIRTVRLNHNTIIRLTTRYIVNTQNNIMDAFNLYELIVNGIVQEQEDELLQITWYSNEQFEHLLHQAKFNLIKIYQETFRDTGPSYIIHAKPK